MLESIAKNSYRKVPYHNFKHGKNVTDTIEILTEEIGVKTKVQEVLKIAGLFHDAGHLYEAKQEDEEKAVKLISKILSKIGYKDEDIQSVGKTIIGTVFKDRGKIESLEQKIIADADISGVGRKYDVFIRDSAKLYIETLKQDEYPSKAGIIEFYKNTLNGFMPYLTSITKDENNPFLLEETKKIFPNFKINRDRLINDLENRKDFLVQIVKQEWKKFYGNKLILFEEIY